MDKRDNELLATLELNEELTNFVREELEGGRSFVDYLRWLVKRDRWNGIKKVVAHLIGEGIESGPAEPLTANYWTRIISGFIATDSKELIGESWPISCRPMVADDLKTLLAEIAPDSDEAARRFLSTDSRFDHSCYRSKAHPRVYDSGLRTEGLDDTSSRTLGGSCRVSGNCCVRN